jgi:hypothetical protein
MVNEQPQNAINEKFLQDKKLETDSKDTLR